MKNLSVISFLFLLLLISFGLYVNERKQTKEINLESKKANKRSMEQLKTTRDMLKSLQDSLVQEHSKTVYLERNNTEYKPLLDKIPSILSSLEYVKNELQKNAKTSVQQTNEKSSYLVGEKKDTTITTIVQDFGYRKDTIRIVQQVQHFTDSSKWLNAILLTDSTGKSRLEAKFRSSYILTGRKVRTLPKRGFWDILPKKQTVILVINKNPYTTNSRQEVILKTE